MGIWAEGLYLSHLSAEKQLFQVNNVGQCYSNQRISTGISDRLDLQILSHVYINSQKKFQLKI